MTDQYLVKRNQPRWTAPDVPLTLFRRPIDAHSWERDVRHSTRRVHWPLHGPRVHYVLKVRQRERFQTSRLERLQVVRSSELLLSKPTLCGNWGDLLARTWTEPAIPVSWKWEFYERWLNKKTHPPHESGEGGSGLTPDR